jgi:twitching motility protein PilT
LIKAGAAPTIRVDGQITPTRLPPLTGEETEELAHSVIYTASRDYLLRFKGAGPEKLQDLDVADETMRRLLAAEELDLVFTIPDLVRVRANLFLQRTTLAAALRIIPLKPPTLDELGLPAVVRELCRSREGLILVTGPTGCGKSTTLAAMLDEINATRACNIVTIEDPIEYVLADQKGVILQREVGRDTRSYETAMKSVLRETPDVIMIGEMRDVETMRVALLAAEMGHLVFSTLHTSSAVATVDRIINAFPPHEKSLIRAELAGVLSGVLSQRLLRKAEGPGRVVAVEVMTHSPTVRKQIEEGNSAELYAAMRDGGHFGMNTMNQALEKHYQAKLVSYDDAVANAGNVAELRQMLRRS